MQAPKRHKRAFFMRSDEKYVFKRACAEWACNAVGEMLFSDVGACTICNRPIENIFFVIHNYCHGLAQMDSCLECLSRYVKWSFDFRNPEKVVRIEPQILGDLLKDLVCELEEDF